MNGRVLAVVLLATVQLVQSDHDAINGARIQKLIQKLATETLGAEYIQVYNYIDRIISLFYCQTAMNDLSLTCTCILECM